MNCSGQECDARSAGTLCVRQPLMDKVIRHRNATLSRAGAAHLAGVDVVVGSHPLPKRPLLRQGKGDFSV